jgi:hypothetical protein
MGRILRSTVLAYLVILLVGVCGWRVGEFLPDQYRAALIVVPVLLAVAVTGGAMLVTGGDVVRLVDLLQRRPPADGPEVDYCELVVARPTARANQRAEGSREAEEVTRAGGSGQGLAEEATVEAGCSRA